MDTLCPYTTLFRSLIWRLGFWCFAVVSRRSFEHQRSPWERLMEEPPPWLSPLRTAWAAAVTPWLRACERFMRWAQAGGPSARSEEHTSELQSLMRISYAVFCLKKNTNTKSRK